MSLPAKVVKDTLRLLGYQVAGKVLSLFSVIAVVRILGVERYGLLAYSFTVAYFLSLFVDFGFTPYMVRSIARDHSVAPAFFVTSIYLKLIQACVGGLLLVVSLMVVHRYAGTEFVYVLLLVPVVEIVYQSSVAVLRSVEDFSAVGRLGLLYDGSRAALVFLLAIATAAVGWVAVGYVTSALVSSVAAYVVLRRKQSVSARRAQHLDLRTFYRGSLWFFVYSIAFQVYFKLDVVMIEFLRGNVEVGIYSAAYRFLEVFLFAPAILMGVLFPRFAMVERPDELAGEVRSAQRYLVVLGMPVVVFCFVFADAIVGLALGVGYAESARPLRVLIVTFGLYLFNCSYPMTINARGQEKRTLMAIVIGIPANVAVNFVLIPRWGALGAAVATLAAEALVTFVYVKNFRALDIPVRFDRAVLRTIGLSAVTVAAAWAVPLSGTWWRLGLVTGLYAVGAVALGVVRREDLATVKRLVTA